MKLKTAAALTVLASCLAPYAQGQTVISTYTLTQYDLLMRSAVTILDDLNGDGHGEWVVGTGRYTTTAEDAGRVVVLSGVDHSVMHTLDGSILDGYLGTSVTNVGDLDGDGLSELGIGAPGEGTFYVYSGASMTLLWSQDHPGLGRSAAAVGDVNGDGLPDIAVGTGGAVRVYEGSTGTLIYHYSNPAFGGLGYSVCAAGDVNGDGLGDVVAGAPFTTLSWGGGEGLVAIIGGPDGTLIDTVEATDFVAFPGDARGMNFGWAVASLGDIEGDGIQEFAVGAPWYGWIHYIDDCWVGVFSGATRELQWSVNGPSDSRFGSAVMSAGDVDLDGRDDLLVGNPSASRVTTFSPARDLELSSWSTGLQPDVGDSLGSGGDVDGDGWPDIAVGAVVSPADPPGTLATATLLGFGCWPDAAYNYCTALPNSTGLPAQMRWQNSMSIADNNFRLYAEDCPAHQNGIFFYGPNAVELSLGGGHICVGGGIFRLGVVGTGSQGMPSQSLDFTNMPSGGEILAGATWHFSFWFRDPAGGGSGFNFADGLRTTFCP